MKITSLRVENVRQFRQPIKIDGLKDGINLFCGPNESGKSTLVRAIRAAFLERHNASTVKDLLPIDEQQASPEIEINFEHAEQQWRLTKRFFGRSRCMLNVNGKQWDGMEAEECLANILGYNVTTRGSSDAKNWGIPGLLWVEQGVGHDVGSSVQYAEGYVRSALGDAPGDIASSSGDSLISKVQALRAELLTASNNRPRGEYDKALKSLDDARDKQQKNNAKLQEYRQHLTELGRLRSQINDDVRQPWLNFRKQAGAAQTALADVERWVHEQQHNRLLLDNCRQRQQWLREELARYEHQQPQLQRYNETAARAQHDYAERCQQVERLQARQEQAAAAHEAARMALSAAHAQAAHDAGARELAGVEQRLAQVAQQWVDVQQMQAELRRLRQELQAVAIDTTALPALRALHDKEQRLQLQREAVATRVSFTLEEGQQLQLGDEALIGQGEHLLLTAKTLHIPGVGQVHIQPGGTDLAECARQLACVADDMRVSLGRLGVASLVEAEQRAEKQRVLTQQIQQQEVLLSRYAPQGVDALHVEQQDLLQRQQQLVAQRAALLPVEGLVLSVPQAEAALEAATVQFQSAERVLNEQKTALALAEQQAQRAVQDAEQLRAQVNSAEYQATLQHLEAELLTRRTEEIELCAKVDSDQQRIEAANPEVLRQDVKRFSASADELEREAHKRQIDLTTLQTRLEQWGTQDIEGECATLAQEIAGLERRCVEFKRRADALTLLQDKLCKKRAAFIQQVQAPLKERINHYLRLLFPQGDIQLSEALAPETLQRAEHEHVRFESLSFGTREQVALLSRLAYADLLKAVERPTLIILDDVLTNSDAQRLDQMKRVLFDAAQRHQILLFSCHPELWRDVGVVARELPALKAGL